MCIKVSTLFSSTVQEELLHYPRHRSGQNVKDLCLSCYVMGKGLSGELSCTWTGLHAHKLLQIWYSFITGSSEELL